MAVCDTADARCKVRVLGPLEALRLNRLIDSIALLDPSCLWAKTWLEGRRAFGRIKVYDWDDGWGGDVHWDYPNDPYAHLHIYFDTFGYDAREFLRFLIHEAAHASKGLIPNEGPGSAEEEAVRCVPEP